MKKKSTLVLIFFLASFLAHSQHQRQGAENIGYNRFIVDVPENSRWLSKKSFNNGVAQQKNVFFYENFETPTQNGNLPEGWHQSRTVQLHELPLEVLENSGWFRNSANYGFDEFYEYIFSGSASMGIGFNAPDYTWAISPEFTIGETDQEVFLSYWAWYYSDEVYFTNYHVAIGLDDNWLMLASFTGSRDASNTFESPKSISLSEFIGQNVRLAFIYEQTDGWQMAIDEIMVATPMENDFGISNMETLPNFGLLVQDELIITGIVHAYGTETGFTNISLLINGVSEQSVTASDLTLGDAVQVQFFWQPTQYGNFNVQLVLSDDEFAGNNTISEDIYVHHYYSIAESFENIEYDELGFPTLIFPPAGWSVSDPEFVSETFEWSVFGPVSALILGRAGFGEQSLTTNAISLSSNDEWISFYLAGVNNSIFVSENASPSGLQGHSTFQLKYAQSLEGPWQELGDPVAFVDEFDREGNILVEANQLRHLQYDISHLQGEYYFAFTATSNFELDIFFPELGDSIAFFSFVLIDNILISGYPGQVTLVFTDENQQLLSDVTVQVFNEANNLIHTTTSDENGSVHFSGPVGASFFQAARLGYVPVQESFEIMPGMEQLSREVILQLADNVYSVTFYVFDQNNNPYQGANISIPTYGITGQTDEQGEFVVHDIAPGFYSYNIEAAEYFTELDLFVIEDENVDVNINLVLYPTSIELYREITFLIYPNPAATHVFVQSDEILEFIEVFNLSGSRVLFEKVYDFRYEINTTGYTSGLYLIKAHTSNGSGVQRLQILQ